LAISPFQQAASTTAGGTRSCPDSLYVDEDTYAIVDTGTTITITNLKKKKMFEIVRRGEAREHQGLQWFNVKVPGERHHRGLYGV
jgi:hypothetical protein